MARKISLNGKIHESTNERKVALNGLIFEETFSAGAPSLTDINSPLQRLDHQYAVIMAHKLNGVLQ